jgi:hypothetical protein
MPCPESPSHARVTRHEVPTWWLNPPVIPSVSRPARRARLAAPFLWAALVAAAWAEAPGLRPSALPNASDPIPPRAAAADGSQPPLEPAPASASAPTAPTAPAPVGPGSPPAPTPAIPDETAIVPGRTPLPTEPRARPPSGLNVRDYGARADGSDDTEPFNAAITASLRGDKVVFVPDGVYALRRLDLPAGVQLIGESRTRTILERRALGEHAGAGFIHIEKVANVSLANLTIRGTGKRLSDTGETGRGDDVLIHLVNARDVRARNLLLVDAQGCGIQVEGDGTFGAVLEDISIVDTYVRDNGFHGVALWAYNGAHDNTFRRITIDGADYAGIMIDAGTTSGPAASVDDNVFENIVIRRVARYHLIDGSYGAGWMWTGGRGNLVDGYLISDVAQGAALAFGPDQSGIESALNTLTDGRMNGIASGIIVSYGQTEVITGTHAVVPVLRWLAES